MQIKNIRGLYNFCKLSYLAFVILFWELNINIVFCADVGYDGTLPANYFGVIFGVHSHRQFITPEHLSKICI